MTFIADMWSIFISVIKSFTVSDALDVILVTFIIYKGIQFARDTRAGQFIKAIIVLIIIWIASTYLQLHMMQSVINAFFQFGIVAIIVLFQPEIRNLLDKIGRSRFSKFFSVNNFTKSDDEEEQKIRHCLNAVAETADQMSKTKTGALIVFERQTRLQEIIDTGTTINAIPSVQMIGNIFFNKAPLHDGAMIIRDGMLYAAGCILPLTRRGDVDPNLGTRHRSALGMSENSDAVVVVVSEETGQISIVLDGNLTRNYTRETLYDELESLLIPEHNEKLTPKKLSSIKKTFRKEGKKK